jgi:hypothetical protein
MHLLPCDCHPAGQSKVSRSRLLADFSSLQPSRAPKRPTGRPTSSLALDLTHAIARDTLPRYSTWPLPGPMDQGGCQRVGREATVLFSWFPILAVSHGFQGPSGVGPSRPAPVENQAHRRPGIMRQPGRWWGRGDERRLTDDRQSPLTDHGTVRMDGTEKGGTTSSLAWPWAGGARPCVALPCLALPASSLPQVGRSRTSSPYIDLALLVLSSVRFSRHPIDLSFTLSVLPLSLCTHQCHSFLGPKSFASFAPTIP